MATVHQAPSETRFFLPGVSWQFYEACLAEIGDRPIRLSYHRGNLEMMSPSREHERCKRLLGRMIEVLTEELDVPMQSSGSTTWRREHLDSGLEPDECYYIQNEPRVRGRDELDLAVDPPPDLAVEVEISRCAVDRMAIYAGLGVPEVWRYDGARLRVCQLDENQQYQTRRRSVALPFLPPEEVERFLARRNDTDETTWVRSFRAWVRESILPDRGE